MWDKTRDNTRDNMRAKFWEFCLFYKDYLKGCRTEEDMTRMTTQAFWESMRLSKKRLDDNGLMMDIDYEERRNAYIDISNIQTDERNTSATLKRSIVVNKTISKGSKILYKKRERQVINISELKANGEGNMAICPNCGHLGTISSYIDGCDYCNTKFQVSDFEEKISSFAMEPDAAKKNNKVFLGILKYVGIALLVMIVIAGLSLIGLIVDLVAGSMDLSIALWMGVIFSVMCLLIPLVVRILIYTGILFLIACALIYKKRFKRIEINDILLDMEQKIPGFSKEEFAANLEFKLRHIHFADNAKDINVFAHTDLSEVMMHYKNVIDCNLVKLQFLNFEEHPYAYRILVKAKMRLTKLYEDKIKEEKEEIYITLSGLRGMHERNMGAVSMYKCEGCGSSISLMNGGICAYCGQRLPYEKYSYIIEGYCANVKEKELSQIKKPVTYGRYKTMDEFKKIRLEISGLFLGLLMVVSAITFSLDNEFAYSLYYISDFFDDCQEMFETIIPADELDNTLVEYEYDSSYIEEKYVYTCTEDVEESAKAYVEYLESQGFEILDSSDKTYDCIKRIQFDDYFKGYCEIVITVNGDKMKVEIGTTDELGY